MPRLSININTDLNNRLDKFLPWGTKQKVMESLCIQLCDAIDIHGPKLVGLLLNKEFNLLTKEVNFAKETSNAA